jgi:glycosyltransferase involved in cell wall biosynthesis
VANKIYIVSEFVDRTRNSTGYYWNKIIRGFINNGICTHVISTEKSLEQIDIHGDLIQLVPIGKSIYYRKEDVLARALGQLKLSFQFFKTLFNNLKHGDVLFTGTNPIFLLIFIAVLKPVIGFKWMLLVHDVFPENLVPAGLSDSQKIRYRIAKSIFDWCYQSADVLIAIGQDMQTLLRDKTKRFNGVEYIPNWVDFSDFSEIEISKELQHLRSENINDTSITFQFFGNFGRVQGIGFLLSAIELVKDSRANFVFIGGGAAEAEIDFFIKNHPNIRIEKKPALPFRQNHEGLFACDVAIISLAPGMLGLAVPSKAFFSLAANKKILVVGDYGSELHNLIISHPSIGWFCPAGDSQRLAKVIEEICQNFNCEINRNQLDLVKEKFSSEIAINKYIKIYHKLI